jgi:hypothetical protein
VFSEEAVSTDPVYFSIHYPSLPAGVEYDFVNGVHDEASCKNQGLYVQQFCVSIQNMMQEACTKSSCNLNNCKDLANDKGVQTACEASKQGEQHCETLPEQSIELCKSLAKEFKQECVLPSSCASLDFSTNQELIEYAACQGVHKSCDDLFMQGKELCTQCA